MAEVYWIHLPEHTDMFSEGYIGVTRNTAQFRFNQHVKDSNRTENGKYHFSRAIRKYGDKLVVQTLVIAEEEYCYELEFKLRPENYIGWNMSAGGQRPIRNPESYGDAWKQKLRDHNLGKEHTQETLDKLSSISKSNWEREEYKDRMIEISKSVRVSEIVVNGWWKKANKTSKALPIADLLYTGYVENENLFIPEVLKVIGLDSSYIQCFRKIARKFRGGWNPHEDPLWIAKFKNEEVIL